MNDWRKPCEHGQYDEHQVVIPCVREHELGRPHEHGFGCLTTEFCPGGSPVTAADLEGLGVKEWYCKRHKHPQARVLCQGVPYHDRCGWRLLIPIPDPQPAI